MAKELKIMNEFDKRVKATRIDAADVFLDNKVVNYYRTSDCTFYLGIFTNEIYVADNQTTHEAVQIDESDIEDMERNVLGGCNE